MERSVKPRIETVITEINNAIKRGKRIINIVTEERGFIAELKEVLGVNLRDKDKRDPWIALNVCDDKKVFIPDIQFEKDVKSFSNHISNFLFNAEKTDRTLFLVGNTEFAYNKDIKEAVEVIYVPFIKRDEIERRIVERAKELYKINGLEAKYGQHEEEIRKSAEETALRLVGLTKSQIEQVISKMESKHDRDFYNPRGNETVKADLCGFAKEMRMSSASDGAVKFIDTDGCCLRGMTKYMKWFEKNKTFIFNPEELKKGAGVSPSKGVLFCGLPGTGKTETARYTAENLKVALLELSLDNFLNMYVGNSEANFARFMKHAESLSPCVVLIDEIEKMLSKVKNGNSGAESSMNIYVALLKWLQNLKSGVFFVAACNSMKDLDDKTELTRSDRIEMKYLVFMPSYSELKDIICAHVEAAYATMGGKAPMDSGSIRKAAEMFLDRIAAYMSENDENYFFTGADAKSLVRITQTELYSEGKRRYSASDYAEKMFNIATEGGFSPYGVEHFGEIADFWIGAKQNGFTNVSESKLFDFNLFNDKGADSYFTEPETDNLYDEWMFKKISAEIIKKMINSDNQK